MEAARAIQEDFWATQPVNIAKELNGDDYEYRVGKYISTGAEDRPTWGSLQNVWWMEIGPTTVTDEMANYFGGPRELTTELQQWSYVAGIWDRYYLEQADSHRDDSIVAQGLVYNEEEQEVIIDYFEEIKMYMEESWAAFVTGTQDIDDDAAWSNYLSTLDNMGLQDCIDATQSCYTRMNE
jgi:hypothetical protein